MNLLNNILLNVNFYGEDVHQGDSVLPFLAFCLHLAGIMVLVLSIINIVCVWRDFNLFYDSSALEKKPDPELKKRKIKKYIIQGVVGLVMTVGAYIYLSINS